MWPRVSSNSLIFNHFYLLVHACVHVPLCVHMTHGSQLSGQPGGLTSLLLLCGTQSSDSGHPSGQ